MAGMSSFFENFQRLASIQAQREAQRLAERQGGAQMMQVFSTVAKNIAPEARTAFVDSFSQQTGLDRNLLMQQAAALGQSLETTRDKAAAAGADSIDPAEVAAVGLTGQNLGQLKTSKEVTRAFEGATPEQMAVFASRQTTGMTPGQAAFDTGLAAIPAAKQQLAGEMSLGLRNTAPQDTAFGLQANQQEINKQLGWEGLHQNERFEAGRQALGIAELQTRQQQILAETKEAGGVLTPANRIALMEMNRQMSDALAKGKMDRVVEGQYISGLMQNYISLGFPPPVARKMSGLEEYEKGKQVQSDWSEVNLPLARPSAR